MNRINDYMNVGRHLLQWCIVAIGALALAAAAQADTGRILLLHTNDLHDHLRPGYIGIGGLPYASGFVKSVRAQRDDVLLVDAGDLLEKGDLLPYKTLGATTLEAMGKVGYDAVTVGNHDLDFGVEHLRRLEKLLGQPLLLLNLQDSRGQPYFEPSRIVEVNGIKVGLIGMINPRKQHLGGLDAEQSGRVLAAEAKRLKESVHLVIAVCHEGSQALLSWSKMAPDVDIFVAGHRHETILSPLESEETGAIIVSAGSDGHWVGHLEVEVDLEARSVTDHRSGLTLLRHDQIEVDAELLSWLEAQEAIWAPRASAPVIDLEAPLGWFAIGGLAAEAARVRAEADVGLFHPTQIVRNGLPAGPLDYNAVFRVSAERVDPLLRLQMTGKEISQYMSGLAMSSWGQTQWAGFSVNIHKDDNGRIIYDNDLDPDRVYAVVMPEREWQRYLVEMFEHAYVRSLERRAKMATTGLQRRDFPGEAVDFVFADAFADYLRSIKSDGERVSERLARLRSAQGDVDPNVAGYEILFLQRLEPDYYLEQEAQTQALDIAPR